MTHPASVDQTLISGPYGETLYPSQSVTVEIRPSDHFSELAGLIRRAYIVNHADTYFSVPARVSVNGRKLAGYISSETVSGSSVATDDDPAVYVFRPYLYGANLSHPSYRA